MGQCTGVFIGVVTARAKPCPKRLYERLGGLCDGKPLPFTLFFIGVTATHTAQLPTLVAAQRLDPAVICKDKETVG